MTGSATRDDHLRQSVVEVNKRVVKRAVVDFLARKNIPREHPDFADSFDIHYVRLWSVRLCSLAGIALLLKGLLM